MQLAGLPPETGRDRVNTIIRSGRAVHPLLGSRWPCRHEASTQEQGVLLVQRGENGPESRLFVSLRWAEAADRSASRYRTSRRSCRTWQGAPRRRCSRRSARDRTNWTPAPSAAAQADSSRSGPIQGQWCRSCRSCNRTTNPEHCRASACTRPAGHCRFLRIGHAAPPADWWTRGDRSCPGTPGWKPRKAK